MPRPTPIRGLGPDSRLAEAARRLVSSRLADVRHEQDALGEALTEDGVHDLRVATRRLRAALKVFRALGGLRPLEREVKKLQDALGEVRVHLGQLGSHDAQLILTDPERVADVFQRRTNALELPVVVARHALGHHSLLAPGHQLGGGLLRSGTRPA